MISSAEDITKSRAVDISVLEKELTELWKKVTEDPDGPTGPETAHYGRICVANLIVVTSDRETGESLDPMINELVARHPSRVIIVAAQPDMDASRVDAWIKMHCHKSSIGSRIICSEQAFISAVGSETEDLPFLILPLLVPDVPTYMWWRAGEPFDSRLFYRLADEVDRVILRSRHFTNPSKDLNKLSSIIENKKINAAVNDMGWTRLATWRELIAQFFDVPQYCACLPRVDKVVIEYEEMKVDSESPRALMMAGWLAARLRWSPLASISHIDKSHCQCVFKSDGNDVCFDFKAIKGGIAKPGGLISITLTCEKTPRAEFKITRRDQLWGYALTSAVVEGKPSQERVIPMEFPTNVELMLRQFGIVGHDVLYETSLKMAAGLYGGEDK